MQHLLMCFGCLQKGSVVEKHCGILLLLCAGLSVTDSGKQHFTAADVDSNKVCWQCCALDLLYTDAPISGPKPAVRACDGTGDGTLHSKALSLPLFISYYCLSSIHLA